jgi:hypothetical protein
VILDGDDGSIGNDGFEIRQSVLEYGVDVFDLRGREAQGNQRGLSRSREGHESGEVEVLGQNHTTLMNGQGHNVRIGQGWWSQIRHPRHIVTELAKKLNCTGSNVEIRQSLIGRRRFVR